MLQQNNKAVLQNVLLSGFIMLWTAIVCAERGAATDSVDIELLRNGKFAEARTYLQSAVRQQPDSAAVHCNLGIALLRLRDYRGALDHLHTAIGLQPQLWPAWLNLAACYVCIGEFERAIEAYKRAEELQPSSASAIEQLVACLGKAQLVDETVGDYSDASWKHWTKGSRIKLYIANGKGVHGYRSSFYRIAFESMRDVVATTADQLQFELVNDPKEANVVCDWIFQDSGSTTLERGITSGKVRNGVLTHASIKVFTNNESGLNCLTDETVRKSCLHEFCHALGIAGHSASPEDIMFAMVECPSVEARLTARDKQTMRALYSR